MDKKKLSERDICTKFITPAVQKAGWDIQDQIREEFSFTDGRILVRGRLHTRAKQRRADYVLSYQKNQPIAIIEAKDNKHSLGDGMQQALAYSDALDAPSSSPATGTASCFTTAPGWAGRPRPSSPWKNSPPRQLYGPAIANGKAWTAQLRKLSSNPTTTMAAAAHRATTRSTPSIAPWRP